MGERGNTLRRREHAARVFSSHSAFVIPVVHRRDAAADPGLSGRFDLARQVQALRAARTILADGGSVLMIDEWVADAFTAPAEALPLRLERRVGCLPGAMGDPETAATGAACGSARCGGNAAQAGFPVGRGGAYRTPAWRFYRLQHPGAQALHSAPANGLTAYYSSIFAKSAWRRVHSIARSMAATIFFPRR